MRAFIFPLEVETPWEFFPVDDDLEPAYPSAEELACHVDGVGPRWADLDTLDDTSTVHYFDDEVAETPDRSVRRARRETTEPVDGLLIRQHYLAG